MEKISFLGMGIMGSAMAANLLAAGYPLTVWNRTAARCKPLTAKGAAAGKTPAEAVAEADIIMYSLANEQAVRDVVFGPKGVLEGVEEGQIAVNFSTVSPAFNRREQEQYATKGVDFVDAPVFGSKEEAEEGALWIVVGGPRACFTRLEPIFDAIGTSHYYMGLAGQGSAMKLVGSLMVAAQLEALGEAMVLATKAGLDPERVLEVVGVADFRSPLLTGVGHNIIERDFSTSFALKHMLKDTNLIIRFATIQGAPVPATAAIRETIRRAVEQGWSDQNASALIKALETQAGVKVKKTP